MNTRTGRVLIFSLSQVITLAISFFISPYLSRALPKTVYASYNQVLIIIGLATILFSMGIQNVVYFLLSKKGDNQSRVISTIQYLILSLGLLASVALFAFSFTAHFFFENDEMDIYIRVCSFSLFATFLTTYFTSVLIFNARAKEVAFISVLVSILTIASIFIALHYYNSVKGALLFSQGVIPLMGSIISFWTVKKYLIFSLKPDRQSIRDIFKVSLPIYFTNILGSSYVYVSSIFVIYFFGDISYANYRNGAIEIPFISTLAFSVSAILLPDITKLFQEGRINEAFELKKKIINQTIFLLYPVIAFFIVFHWEFIVSYFSSKYADSAVIFAFYSFTCFIRINDYQDVLISSGNSNYIFKANVLYFAINLLFVFIFGKMFGINGVACAASLSVFVLAFTLLRKDARIFKKKISNFFDFKSILNIVIIAFIVLFFLKLGLMPLFQLKAPIVLLISALLYFPFIYILIFRRGYIISSIVTVLSNRLPFISFILRKK